MSGSSWKRGDDYYIVSSFKGYGDAPYQVSMTMHGESKPKQFSAWKPVPPGGNPYRDIGYECLGIRLVADEAKQLCVEDYRS